MSSLACIQTFGRLYHGDSSRVHKWIGHRRSHVLFSTIDLNSKTRKYSYLYYTCFINSEWFAECNTIEWKFPHTIGQTNKYLINRERHSIIDVKKIYQKRMKIYLGGCKRIIYYIKIWDVIKRKCQITCMLYKKENRSLDHHFYCEKCRNSRSVLKDAFYSKMNINVRFTILVMWD